ncbi:MAG: PPC domain-containing protein [Microcoleaceae cyanobacterium]
MFQVKSTRRIQVAYFLGFAATPILLLSGQSIGVAQEATPQPNPPSSIPSPVPQPETPDVAPSPQPVAPTSEVILNETGELQDGDPVLQSDNSLYDEYTFEGKQNQQIVITLESNSFDPYLALFLITQGQPGATQPNQPGRQLLQEHDDVSDTDNSSRIIATLPADGTYSVIVNSYSEKGRGQYNLQVKSNNLAENQ